MKTFKSAFAPSIKSYLEFRKAMNYGGEGEQGYLSSFDAYCHEHFPNEKHLTKDAVRGWFFEEISRERLALENKAITILMFAKYLGSSAYTLPMNCVPKTIRYVPYIMTDQELSDFFDAADRLSSYRHDPFLKGEMPILLRFIYACGLRPGEALRLKTEDVDLGNGEVFIKNTKRHKDRIIVASANALTLLKKHDFRRKISVGQTEHFFCTGEGLQMKLSQLDRCVNECWRLANPEIDLQQLPRVRAYDLRHRFASAVLQGWIDQGRNLYAMFPYLRAYMGHQSFSDTVYYIHLLPDHLIKSPGVDWENIDRVGLEEGLWNN